MTKEEPRMKKVLSLLVALVMLLSVACFAEGPT